MTLSLAIDTPFPGSTLLAGSLARVDFELVNDGDSAAVHGDVTLVDDATGTRRGVLPAGEVAAGATRRAGADLSWMTRAVGIHHIHVECDGAVRSPAIAVEVAAGRYRDGGALAEMHGHDLIQVALGLDASERVAAHVKRTGHLSPPAADAIAEAIGTLTLAVGPGARQPTVPIGWSDVGWDVAWLDDTALLAGSLSPVMGVERVELAAPRVLLAAFVAPAYALDVLVVVGGELVHVSFGPHHLPDRAGRVTWSAPLPPAMTGLVSGAAVRAGEGYAVALLGRTDEGALLAHALCDPSAPPGGFRVQPFAGARLVDDAPPALDADGLAGALLHLPEPRPGEEPAWRWSLVSWSLTDDAVEARGVDLTPTRARLAYRTLHDAPSPSLVAALEDETGAVSLVTEDTITPQGRWGAAPLALACDGTNLYLLRVDPVRGPRLIRAADSSR
jgi:hypothetical protein